MRVSQEIRGDERLVMLAIALDGRVGLTFEEMRDQGLLGNRRNKEQSLKRALSRAFAQFDSMGIKVIETEVAGEKRYRIDARTTYAQPAEIGLSEDEAAQALAAVTAYLDGAHRPYENDVRRAREKLASVTGLTGSNIMAHPFDRDDPDSERIWHTLFTCRANLHPCTFSYRNAGGVVSEHQVRIWGFFDRGKKTYMVGYDEGHADDNPVRIFRLDRIELEGMHADTSATYLVPADFSIDDFRRLPFEYGDEEPLLVSFTCSDADKDRVGRLTEGRGAWERRDGRWIWAITTNDINACASWAAGAAAEGLVAMAPAELIGILRDGLERTAARHG